LSSMKPRAKYGDWLRAPSRSSGAGSRSSCGFSMIGQADGFILKRWERRGPSVWNRLVGDTIIAAGKGWRNRFLGNREKFEV
jgi:hypothetical protein